MERGERSLQVLLAQHRDGIDQLKKECAELELWQKGEEGKLHDDIFLLRYCLSFESKQERLGMIIACLSWRSKNQALIQDVRAGKPWIGRDTIRMDDFKAVFTDHLFMVRGGLSDGGPLYVVRAGLSDSKKAMDLLSGDEMLEFLMYTKEMTFQECDRSTRQTGNLVKMVSMQDFHGLSLFSSKGRDRRFFKQLGASSKLAEFLYPQLAEKNVMINTPSWFSKLFSFASFFMPKRALSKVGVCPAQNLLPAEERSALASKKKKGLLAPDISKCPFASLLNLTNVPTWFGGHKLGMPPTLIEYMAQKKSQQEHDAEIRVEDTCNASDRVDMK